MRFPRSSGILLHPTSLPGKYGIGDLGPMAFSFVDFLHEAGQMVWQVLPLGPTSYGDSPYQALSAFAGNPLLVSLDKLIEAGWLTVDDVVGVPELSPYRVDYGPVISYHDMMLTKAYQHFEKLAGSDQKADFAKWQADNAEWLDDYSLFVALKDSHNGKPWTEWPEDEALHKDAALATARTRLAERINDHRFRQWLFFTQWNTLKTYANGKKIRLIGDIPIFVAHDSSDVWAHKECYYLDAAGNPTVVAGVPPDYFSETGQRWGNPLYRWEVRENYDWWIKRIKASLQIVDRVRIDHFRGFEAYWEVPASEKTAVKGRWAKGPGASLFQAIHDALGDLPIIAEDLGVMTPEVYALRDGFDLPGMKVLHFAFEYPFNPDNAFLPHNYSPNFVAYTGTHDNNTTYSWYKSETHGIQEMVQDYGGHMFYEPHWDCIRLLMRSVADTVVFPLQDIFGFGEDTRMNMPGRPDGNWQWRFTEEWLKNPAKEKLAAMTERYGRAAKKPKKKTTAEQAKVTEVSS